MTQEELEKISKKQLSLTASEIDKRLKSIPAMQEKIDALSQSISPNVYGYMRVSGVSDPQLSYRHYAGSDEFAQDPFSIFYPCLVGNNFTGKVGQILHILRKLDYETDLQGRKHAIDSSEGELMICNIQPFYKLFGKYVIEDVTYDIFLLSLMPFSLAGYEAEKVEKQGHSADYCVAHKDADGVTRMHSCYNPAWLGSYTSNSIVKGSYVYTEENGTITETYEEEEPMLHSTGAGLSSTNFSLHTGEQYAMNINEDKESTVPFMNSTAGMWEIITDIMLAEGGTFAAHKPSLMGSGFSSNSPSVAASYEEATTEAYNGCRFVDSKGVMQYLNFSYSDAGWFGGKLHCFASLLNEWRTPWRIMERQRAMSYAIRNGIPELTWFAFEGTKYKWRSVEGFKTPLQGEMTCVLTKIMKTKFAAGAEDPYNAGGDLSGKDLEFVISTALYHGVVTDASPSWWTSGLIFVEDSKKNMQCYYQRDQSKLILSRHSDINEGEIYSFERTYTKVLTLTKSHGTYVRDYNALCHIVPAEENANNASLYTYIGRYWYNGSTVATGKRSVRGFRRGGSASNGVLSPLCVYADTSPSYGYSNFAFGTCVQIADE